MPSFDIVNEIDLQEVDNAVNNTLKEATNRYDFRGLQTEVNFDRKAKTIDLLAAESMKMRALKEMLNGHLIKRSLDPKALSYGDEEPTSMGAVKLTIQIQEGIDRETAKKIVKKIKDSKLKVQPSIQQDQVRVNGKKIDDLQEVIRLLKSKNFGLPLQFINMRS